MRVESEVQLGDVMHRRLPEKTGDRSTQYRGMDVVR